MEEWALKKTHCEDNLDDEEKFSEVVRTKISVDKREQLSHGFMIYQPHFKTKDDSGKCVAQYQLGPIMDGDLASWFEKVSAATSDKPCKQIIHDTAVILRRLLDAVFWMADQGYVQNDVHPKNVLVQLIPETHHIASKFCLDIFWVCSSTWRSMCLAALCSAPSALLLLSLTCPTPTISQRSSFPVSL